jgi:hypothetical protein
VSEKINWNVMARAEAGPEIAASDAIDVDAYDKLEVTIPDAANKRAVNIAPVKWSSVQFLALNPRKADASLTYESGGTKIPLDGPHFLVGAGAVKLLGNGDATLKFSNATGADAIVDILVGRDAA